MGDGQYICGYMDISTDIRAYMCLNIIILAEHDHRNSARTHDSDTTESLSSLPGLHGRAYVNTRGEKSRF